MKSEFYEQQQQVEDQDSCIDIDDAQGKILIDFEDVRLKEELEKQEQNQKLVKAADPD